MVTVHHDKTGDIYNFDDLEIAGDEHFHNFVKSMAEGNMLIDLETRFDYNQSATEQTFYATFQSLSGQRLRWVLELLFSRTLSLDDFRDCLNALVIL